ncbi:hypothetical protein NFI96_006121 [Prochilodus magdalenae]|nr:hypothetical protein NFI96_006121 [Prochilodus magdalenae]
MERATKRKREMMKELFSPGVNIFRVNTIHERRSFFGGRRRRVKESPSNGEELVELQEEEEPQKDSWPVLVNGEPLTISVKPLHPIPDEPIPSEPSPTEDTTDAETVDVQKDVEGSVLLERALKTEETVSEPVERASESQTDLSKAEQASSELVDEAGRETGTETQAKCKTRRWSLVGWINDKLKEKHQKSMKKSMKKVEEYEHRLVLIRSTGRMGSPWLSTSRPKGNNCRRRKEKKSEKKVEKKV